MKRMEKFFIAAVLSFTIIAAVLIFFDHIPPSHATGSNLKVFHTSELAQYDGTNPGKPIYIGFEGKVYDVSSGSSYYKIGGVYHFLAGRDSTVQLEIAGGAIIKRKYPIVGILK